MFQAYEQLLQRYPAFRTLPLAALTPPPQALEYLARCTIPTLSFVTPYRLEHPHSALVRKHAELTRQDTLYTPAGCGHTLTRRVSLPIMRVIMRWPLPLFFLCLLKGGHTERLISVCYNAFCENKRRDLR